MCTEVKIWRVSWFFMFVTFDLFDLPRFMQSSRTSFLNYDVFELLVSVRVVELFRDLVMT